MKANKFNIITIDGPAASGKSSIARSLGKKINYCVINSGNLYRSVAWLAIKNNVNQDEKNFIHLIKDNSFSCDFHDNKMRIFINDEIVPSILSSKEINSLVSKIATIDEIRHKMNEIQRYCSTISDVICEGRDAGTVVFPNANYKFYIDARPEVRQERRLAQGLQDDLLKRDFIDSNRKNSPLKPSDDAVIIDNSDISLEKVIEIIINHINS